jgi:hypothetical protein
MQFFYVAMRYDPIAGHLPSGPVDAETIRISFDTPAPYYPYYEPERPPDEGDERLMLLWLVSRALQVPVSAQASEGQLRWVRPLKAGEVRREIYMLKRAIDSELASLLSDGEWVIQTFQDQKRSRRGFGDILFVPKEPTHMRDADRAAWKPLLGVLAPALSDE